MYFVNVNGLRLGPSGGDFSELCTNMDEAHIDILGLAETKLNTCHRSVVSTCAAASRRTFKFSQVVLASSAINYNGQFKPGGTALITAGSTTGRITNSVQDPMGRWCATSYLGARAKIVTVISAYQVCDTPPDKNLQNRNITARTMAAVSQQQAMMQTANPASTEHPRHRFRKDILSFIRTLQQDNHEIVLMGDFNEEYGADPEGMIEIATVCSLVDIFHRRLGSSKFATFIGGRTRIDYALVSAGPAAAVRQCGFEPPAFRFKGDHRGLFLEFDTNMLFGNTTPTLASPASRHVRSNDRTNCARFVEAKFKYLKEHNWFQRMSTIKQTPQLDHKNAESLDRDWLRASLYAENLCSSRPTPPYSTILAQSRNRRSALRIVTSALKRNANIKDAYVRASAKTHMPLPPTLEKCISELRELSRSITNLEKEGAQLRLAEQKTHLARCLQQKDRAGAKAIRKIMNAEATKEMWRQLRNLQPSSDPGITTIEVPSNGDLSTSHCKNCQSWKLLTDPTEIRHALICRNRLHFGQAHGTFPTIPPFSESVDWAASTLSAEAILEGHLPFEDENLDDASTSFLHQLKVSTALNSISSIVTEKEWLGKMTVWRESTTTSPSGMHLGHHKALIKEFPISEANSPRELQTTESMRQHLLRGQLNLLNYAIKHSYCYERWKKVATFMIRKDQNSSRIHRLRVIHLYEADLNLLLGVKWRSLTHHCIDNALLNPGQFGGLPGKDAMTPVFLEELQWETTRASRKTLLRMDFDASSCYDRIIPSIASLASRSFGQHQTLCFIHATFLRQAKYKLKTKLGLSDEDYSHCHLHPIYGTGQGSTNSPVIWVLISSRLFDAHATRAHGANFVSPDGSYHLRVFMIGFVDDSYACVNDFTNPIQSPDLLLGQATADAQLWNDLLSSSGGALEIPKCVYHLAHYGFTEAGCPVLQPSPVDKPPLQIQEARATSSHSFQCLSPYAARKTLGCFKTPSSNFKQSLKYIQAIAMEKSKLLLHHYVDVKSAYQFYFSIFLPSVTYSFPTNTIPEGPLTTVQNASVRPILSRMGLARNTPHAILYGPQSLGGVGLRSFYDEQGSSQMELVLKHSRSSTMVTTQLHIALAWCQRHAGISTPLLEFPATPLPHLETSFFPSLRTYLASTKSALLLENSHVTPLQRTGDFHLMDRVLQSNKFTSRQIRQINYCRLFLQVHTVSDLATALGTHIDPSLFSGQPSLLSSNSTEHEIRQERPNTAAAWAAWRKSCSLWCDTKSGKLHQPLGSWLLPSVSLRRTWPFHWDPSSGCLLVRTLEGYSVHHPFSRGPKGMRFHRDAAQHTLTLSSTCFPTEAIEIRLGFIRLPGPELASPLQDLPSITFDDFLFAQPSWTQRLLQFLDPKFSYPIIYHLLHTSTSPLAVSDGSVLRSQGTFGWVLATTQPPHQLLHCSGPAFGASMDSYRAEAYGLLSLATLLDLMSKFFHRPLPPITIWCDNLSVVQTINSIITRVRPVFPNDTLRPSWDIIQATCRTFQAHPSLSLQHVKGHQDRTTPFWNLPLEAQLNVQADKLATAFQEESSHGTDRGPMIPGTGCQLVMENQVISSNHRRRIRNRRGKEKLMTYIQEKLQITPKELLHIDWESHSHAIRSVPIPNHTFLIKFLHRWLPVGKRVHQYNPSIYPSHCPSCLFPIEDFDHTFRCPSPLRRRWQINLRHDLFKLFQRSNTDPVLVNIVIDGLFHWFRQTPQSPQSISPTYDELIISQGQIGWSQLLLGRWSREWATLQTKYLQRTNSIFTSQNHGTLWLSSIIQLIWTHCYDEWINRNNALHGHNQQTKIQARTTRAQYKIRALYSLRHHCSHLARRNWFYESPEAHFTRQADPRHLENWIALNEARILSQVTHHQQHTRTGQRSIEEYFPPIT